jgi:RpiB/LacA/LacB family sugar-phosphate isomerase
VIGSDHAGVDLKKLITDDLTSRGFEPVDVGTYTYESVDYPDYARKVGQAVRGGVAEKAILICGSGIGASVAANKIEGIRAGLAHDYYSAHHGARVIGTETAKELAHAFLSAKFTGEERHLRRLAKIHQLEENRGR